MSSRWSILAILFLARLSMAFQFQTVAALSPLMVETLGLDLATVGLLIGLYLAPGVVIALPGGAFAARFGDKRVVGWSMVLMLLGGVMISVATDTTLLAAGRLVAGAGGVALNVVMTKMVTDWFAGREISTAMAVFVNSWPVGIALALFTLPLIATAGGMALAIWTGNGLIAATLVIFALGYRAAPQPAGSAAAAAIPAALPYLPLICASLIWAFYNTALLLVFSFGPQLLVDRDWSLPAAGSLISGFMLVFAVALPLGGIIADRSGRRDAVIAVSLISFAALMPLALITTGTGTAAILLLVGALYAFGAGPIMTLPARVLSPQNRAFGMGLFYTLYYATLMIAPRIAGRLADSTGKVTVTFVSGIVLCLAALLALALYRRVLRS